MITVSLAQLDKWIKQFPKAVLQLEENILSAKTLPNKWSKKEIIGHLIDSAQYNLKRFSRATLTQEDYQLIAYPQDDLVIKNQYQNAPLTHLLNLWQSLNRQIHVVCSALTEQELTHGILLPYGDKVDLTFLINDYVAHFEHHLFQILTPDELQLKNQEPDGISYQEANQGLQAVYTKEKFITLLKHGSMSVELYAPDKVDLQQPHQQDELYLIVSGRGTFFKSGKRFPFQQGDVIFVGAGKEHRFENFTADFQTWVIFYGAVGGE